MAEASKKNVSAKETEEAAKPQIELEETLDDEALDEVGEGEPVEAIDNDKSDSVESSLTEEDGEDLLEGIPEEELKAASDVQLPKITKSKTRSARNVRKRSADGSVNMPRSHPVRMYLK